MTEIVAEAGSAPTILLEVSPLAQGAQGIATYIRGLVGGLDHLVESREISARFKLLFINPHTQPPPPPSPAFENVVLEFPRRLAQGFWARFPLFPLDAFVKGDLFHGCSHIVPHTRCPAWVTMHDVSWRAHPESFSSRQRSFNERFCGPSLRHCLASGGGVLAVSRFTAGEVERHYEVPVDRQIVVHEGEGTSFAACDGSARTEARAWLGLDGNRPYALCLGLVETRKNIEGAIELWEDLRRRNVDCALAIVGKDGEGSDKIRQRIANSPWKDDILLPGRAPTRLLGALYAEARATLFLSHYEGFGLPVLESMAAGTPVIVSDRASLPEIWGTPPAGVPRLVVDSSDFRQGADLLESLVTDEAVRRSCIDYGQARVKDFSWVRAARETWAAWQSSLSNRGRLEISRKGQR